MKNVEHLISIIYFIRWWRLLYSLLLLPEKTYQSKELYLSILSALNICIEYKVKIFYHYIALSVKSFIGFLVNIIPLIRIETAKLFRCLPLEMNNDILFETIKSLMIWNNNNVDECNGYIVGLSYLISGLSNEQYKSFNNIISEICVNIYKLLFVNNSIPFQNSCIQAITTISKCHKYNLPLEGDITRKTLYDNIYKSLENKPTNNVFLTYF